MEGQGVSEVWRGRRGREENSTGWVRWKTNFVAIDNGDTMHRQMSVVCLSNLIARGE